MNQNHKQKQQAYAPPFCPNPDCSCHDLKRKSRFYKKNGWLRTLKFPGFSQKYRCKICGREFCYNYFFLSYRRRKRELMQEVFESVVHGMTNCSIATRLKISESKVRSMIKTMKRQGMLRMEEIISKRKSIDEPLVADGFESFVYDQYSPNNINTFVGKKSLFVHHVNYSPLNRKGRMTERQKKKNKKLQQQFGKYPSNSIYQQFLQGLKFINKESTEKVILYTDKKKEYQRAIKNNFPEKFDHDLTDSKEQRDVHNKLFAVNKLDLLLRHYLSSFRRETIAFPKRESGLMDRVFLLIFHLNFMRGKFSKPNPEDLTRHKRSPAMDAGFEESILSFDDFFNHRRTSKQIEIRKNWLDYYFDRYDFSRFVQAEYAGI